MGDRFSRHGDEHDGFLSGSEYRKLLRPGEFLSNKWNVSLSLNTDGVAVYKTSCIGSLWPVYLVVNELPARLRYDSVWQHDC